MSCRGKRRFVKGGVRSPRKQNQSSHNVTIDLTESINMDKVPEVIDLDDIDDDDDDDIEVVAVQLGTRAPKKLVGKADLSVILIEDKPIEDTSFKSKECPFTYGMKGLREEVDKLERTIKIDKDLSPNSSKQKKNMEPIIAKLYEIKEKPGLANNPAKKSPNNLCGVLAGKKMNNLFQNFANGQKNVLCLGKKKKNKSNNLANRFKKVTNGQNPQKRNFNSDKQSLKFISATHQRGFKNKKKPKPRYHQGILNGRQNCQPNCNPFTNIKSRPFVHSKAQNEVSALLGITKPKITNLNFILPNDCSENEKSDCEIVGSSVKAPTVLPKWTTFGLNAYVSPTSGDKTDNLPGQPRPIFIDGSNVAMAHGKNKYFSSIGIKLCIDFFITRGHKRVKAIVPQYRRKSNESRDSHILEKLEKDGQVVFTPSRVVGGHRISSYDDRYIVQCAATVGGIIVSNDNFRDLYDEEESWRETIETRILQFTWIEDGWIMFAKDPLGRSGPPLDDFLLF